MGLVATLFVLLLEVHQSAPRITILCTLIVYLLHLCRRLYECRFVSVYGHGQMSLTHFILGIAFYIVTPASLFASRLYASDRSWTVMALFVLKTSGLQYAQHVVCKQLAELRKSPTSTSGRNQPTGYYIPKGTMFRYISCPHYLYEIALYLTLHIFVSVSWIPFSHMVLFVIFNQVCSAWLTHSWYQCRFPEWAANRKALLPFVW
ncbi:unnamed protein product [Dicrocoelium dendriticum]|nr:unnamed protein product [Dicrocoelium dendriticum]